MNRWPDAPARDIPRWRVGLTITEEPSLILPFATVGRRLYNEDGERRAKPRVTVDNQRDELSVHQERALLVSVPLPERPWFSEVPLQELRGLAKQGTLLMDAEFVTLIIYSHAGLGPPFSIFIEEAPAHRRE